jgi:tRNA threonylcarbamoyladenosine biosynthesis protein TsaE
VNEYRRGRHRLYHVDLYRLEGEEQVATLGLDDYLDGSGVVVVEWPAEARPWLPDEHLSVRFSHLNETKRTLRFRARGARYAELLDAFKKDAFGG